MKGSIIFENERNRRDESDAHIINQLVINVDRLACELVKYIYFDLYMRLGVDVQKKI